MNDQPVDLATELLINTLNTNSELSLLASAWAGNYDSRKNGKRFSSEIKKITDRNRRNFEDIMKRHAPEYGGLDIREVERTVDRLPRKIYYNGKVLELKYYYTGTLDDRWVLSYGTDDPKDCFIHRDESTLEACVLGAWRNLALKKHEWDEVLKEDK